MGSKVGSVQRSRSPRDSAHILGVVLQAPSFSFILCTQEKLQLASLYFFLTEISSLVLIKFYVPVFGHGCPCLFGKLNHVFVKNIMVL